MTEAKTHVADFNEEPTVMHSPLAKFWNVLTILMSSSFFFFS